MKSAHLILPILFGVTLTACQTVPTATPVNQTIPKNKTIAMIPTLQDLQSYHWQLVQAKDNANQPLTSFENSITHGTAKLNFSDKRIDFTIGCNQLSKPIAYQNGTMTSLSSITVSTLMGCGKDNDTEQLLKAKMNRTSRLSLEVGQNIVPTLTQVTADNSTLVWQGTIKPEVKYGKGETVFFEVKPQLAPCDPLTGKQCLQIREISYDNNGIKTATGQWRIFHEPIDGFHLEPTTQQIIRVQRYRTPPTDTMGYGTKYVFDSVIESELISQTAHR